MLQEGSQEDRMLACKGKERGENEGRRGERVSDGGEEVGVERQRE